MKIRKEITSLLFIFILSCVSAGSNNNGIDRNLIIPGKSAEGYNIGNTFKNNTDIIFTGKETEIGNIFELEVFSNLKFDSYIYIKDSAVIFLNKGIITAIAGLKTERRVTSDAVLLSKGIDNFILNYGNSGLRTISKNGHKVYIYNELGIALFNDNSNNIDLYLVFRK